MIFNTRKICLAFLIYLLSVPADAYLVSGDDDYFVTRDGNYTFIYSENEKTIMPALIEQNRAFKKLYENEFAWKLDEPPFLILASPRNQVTNGFATIYPTLHTVFFDGGAAAVDEFAASSWIFTLLSHETAHLYQTNVKHEFSQTLKQVLGNPAPNIVPPFPYMVAPNIFAPTFLLEGNATFNEGRFGNGGRLYNGVYRALFLNLLAAGKINPKRLINDHLYWPYTQEKYIVGAYFNLQLAQRHGIERVNQFFSNNARHYINPFQLEKSFSETFGYSYVEAIKNLNADYARLASALHRQAGKSFAHSEQHVGFNREGDKVLFLTSDNKSRPRLTRVSSTGASQSEKLNIPFGSVFLIGNDVFVPSAQVISANEIRFGLFGEGVKPLPQYYDKFVFDIFENKTAYANVPKSFVTTQLYVDEKFIDSVQSSALFSSQGELIYFKQNGRTRELYRNDLKGNANKIAEYQGYFGKPVDITPNGDVYFIGSTNAGATLFRLSVAAKKVERVLAADTIVDAKFINADQWVVAEITANGYEYKIVSLDTAKVEQPAYYQYFFDDADTQKFYQPLAVVTEQKTPTESAPPPLVSEPYSTISHMKFNAIDPLAFGYSSIGGFVGGLQVSFSDPLEYQKILLTYLRNLGSTNDASLFYLNSKYLVNFDVGVTLDQSAVFTDSTQETVEKRFNTYGGTIGAQYHLYQRGQIDSQFRTRYSYEYEDTNTIYDNDIEREHSLLTELTWTRTLAFGTAFDTNSQQNFLLGHEIVRDAMHFKDQNVHYVAEVNLIEDLFKENFISASYKSVLSEARYGDIKISESLPDLDIAKSTTVSRFTQDTARQYVQVNKVSAGYKKAINLGIYFTTVPIAVRRFAPFAKYQEFYAAENRGDKLATIFHEWSYGAEIEFLLFHKFPFRFIASKAEMNKRTGSTFSAMFSTGKEF